MNGRDKRRAKAARNAARELKPVCLNCGEQGHHFVPPSLGESGYFACKRASSDGSYHPELIPTDLFVDPLAHRMIGTRLHQQVEDHFQQLNPRFFRNIDRLFEE